MQHQQTALVTGASGFIGSELVRELNRRGIRARALLRRTSSLENLKDAHYERVEGDLADAKALREAVQGVDYVFHLAGAIAAKTRDEYFRHNAEGTENLARAVADVQPSLKRFVYVSSLAAGGPATSREPRIESLTDAPISAYGESKREGEVRLRKWAQQAGFGFTSLRPPAVFGPRDKGIFEFIKLANARICPLLPSKDESGDKFYSVIFVEDLVSVIADAALNQKQRPEEIFYVAEDRIYSFREVIDAISLALGKKTVPIRIPRMGLGAIVSFYSMLSKMTGKSFPLTKDKMHEILPDYWICSPERAKEVLGFQPKQSLPEAMKKTVQWYKENGWIR